MNAQNIRNAGRDNVEYTRNISSELIEKAMEMRCRSYLSQVKADLLTETIFEVDKSRKNIRKANEKLEIRVKDRTKSLQDSNKALQHEIKKHMQTEDQLRKLSEAIEHAGEGIFITDKTAKIEYVNQAFCKTMGYSADEILGNTPAMWKSGVQGKDFYENLWSTILSGQAWNGSVINKKKDGEQIPLMMTIAPILDRHDNICSFVASQQDMTKQRELEDQFQQAQKMEALGTLVGGIAHDFNNMLAAMIGNIYLLKMEPFSASTEAREHLNGIETLAFRASEMIKQLLVFARKGTVSKTAVPFTTLMKEAFKLQQVAVPEDITFNHSFSSEELNVFADATQLQQVFINLINNARDAVEGSASPSINVQLEAFEADDAFLKQHSSAENCKFAHLSITDNGCGIDQAEIEKIFDPFYTTKEVGKGTGLGLAMVFGAIRSYEGWVDVESNNGQGTSFHIYIPLLPSADEMTSQQPSPEVIVGKGETILLVDDNAQLLVSSKKVLEKMGYAVVTAVDGLEAIDTYTEQHETIDLIILDLVMPNMSGGDAAREIIAAFPDAKIMFATAYDSSGKLTRDMASEYVVLEKPFAIPLLSAAIRKQLDR